MSKSIISIIVILLVICFSQADTIVLKNGMKLEGKYQGGTQSTIRFETGGAVQEIAVSEVVSILFSGSEAASSGLQSGSSHQGSALSSGSALGSGGTMKASGLSSATPTEGPLTIPAGTRLIVKIDKPINTMNHAKGSLISGVLDADLVADGKLVAAKGTPLYGIVVESIGGKRIGKQRLTVQFNQIVIDGQRLDIQTPVIGAEGGSGGALRKVAAGALIGGAIDGKKGARTGALLGAGASVLSGGRHIQIPAGTLAEVPLQSPLQIGH